MKKNDYDRMSWSDEIGFVIYMHTSFWKKIVPTFHFFLYIRRRIGLFIIPQKLHQNN